MPQVQIVRIDASLLWKAARTQNGNWVAACDPLKLTLQSETWADLMEDIALSLDAILKEMLKTNELPRFLREHGWTAVGTIPSRPQAIRSVHFDVPFIPAVVSGNDFQRELCQ
jgi:hypothetical protein